MLSVCRGMRSVWFKASSLQPPDIFPLPFTVCSVVQKSTATDQQCSAESLSLCLESHRPGCVLSYPRDTKFRGSLKNFTFDTQLLKTQSASARMQSLCNASYGHLLEWKGFTWKVREHCRRWDGYSPPCLYYMGIVYKLLRSVTQKLQSLVFLVWNGDILTLQVHFFSFREHLVASAASCTAWMIMLVTCLNENKKGKWGTKASHCFVSTCFLLTDHCHFSSSSPVTIQHCPHDMTIAKRLLDLPCCSSPSSPVPCPRQRPAVTAQGQRL